MEKVITINTSNKNYNKHYNNNGYKIKISVLFWLLRVGRSYLHMHKNIYAQIRVCIFKNS